MAVLLQIRNAHKSFGEQVLLDGAEATITDDVKVGFVGRNGAGNRLCFESSSVTKNWNKAMSSGIPICESDTCANMIRSSQVNRRSIS